MVNIESVLEGLNSQQKQAVQATEGPLLIQAGAGSGKTKTLTHRVAFILLKNLAFGPQILAVTFTNKAAGEMRQRVAKLLDQNPDDRTFLPYMGTFHSVCVRILRQEGQAIGIPPSFVIYDTADKLAAIKQACRELNIDQKLFPATQISALISSAKNQGLSSDQYLGIANSPAQQTAAQVYPLYQKILRQASALDFDDLLLLTVKLFKQNREIRQVYQQQFRYIMIDEYQDTNSVQYQLIKLLVNEHKNLAVVGDDWQSIYMFRGADFQNILNFERDFPNTTVIKLEQNYRSTGPILEASHAVISKNKQRSDKKLWTDQNGGKPIQIVSVGTQRDEAESIVRRIRQAVSAQHRNWKDFCVLYRTNAQSRAIEEAFLRYSVPYKIVGGQRFYDRKEIKDILAYLRLIFQPSDTVSFNRIVNVPTRGIGAKSLQRFFDYQAANDLSLLAALQSADKIAKLPSKAKQGFADLAEIITSSQQILDQVAPQTLIEKLINKINYQDFLDDGTPAGQARQENVQELLSVASSYADLGLSGFLEEISLISDLDNLDSQLDAVALMTVHAAKGLEFPVVFMAGMEESIFPHSRALYDHSELEEERRLCYVGMTRAEEELYMYHTATRMLYGDSRSNPPARFLSEISGEEVREGYLSQNNFKSTQQPSFSRSSEKDLQDWAQKMPKSKPSTQRYQPEFYVGMKVKHQLFGVGKIIDQQDSTLAIDFGSKGVKKLNADFAPLQQV